MAPAIARTRSHFRGTESFSSADHQSLSKAVTAELKARRSDKQDLTMSASGILKIAFVGSGSVNPEWTSEVSNSTNFSGWSLADLWLPLSIAC